MTQRKPRDVRQPQPVTQIVQAEGLASREMYSYPDGRKEAVLRGITLDVKRGECLGVIGEEPFELELLMQVIANVRPYGEGRCALVERGMMRRKRVILPHVFYINGGDTVPGNLNTLEYLMYVTAATDVPDRARQVSILEVLLASGLYPLTLVPMKFLSAAERAAICLLSAALGKALLVVFSVAELTFPPQLAQGVRHVTEMIEARGGALLIGTGDCDLVQAACTHAAFLIGGQLAQHGTVAALLQALDRRAFVLTAPEPDALAQAIRDASPTLQPYVFGSEVHVYTATEEPLTQEAMLRILLDAGLAVESIQASRRTLRNAYREVLAGHVV